MAGGRQPNRNPEASDLTGLNEQLRRAIQSGLRPDLLGTHAAELSAEVLSQNLSALAEHQRDVWREGLARMEATYRRNLPENWRSIDSSLLDVLAVVKESGISLVWAPRGELILRLVAATTRAKLEGLLEAATLSWRISTRRCGQSARSNSQGLRQRRRSPRMRSLRHTMDT